MKENNPAICPARRLDTVQEYYFSRKGKEVARLNAEGRDIISLAIGSPDMPPSPQTVDTLCREAQRPDAHGYQPTAGIPQLREAMAGFTGDGSESRSTPPPKSSPSSVRRRASCM